MKPESMKGSRGVRFGGETITQIEASADLKPLRDTLILEPLDVVYSHIIYVRNLHKPLRGKVLRVGPGHYPKRYDHPEKHKRKKMWDSRHFVPTEVKEGDIVELGGAEIEGYSFETFRWGNKHCIWCTERDVAGIVDQGTTARPQTLQRRQLQSHATG